LYERFVEERTKKTRAMIEDNDSWLYLRGVVCFHNQQRVAFSYDPCTTPPC
jgi:hypothetical protein